ncbi:RHS repeat-associated core domain-containing protein [Flavobacterium sp. LHD-80]|uniref:RHS repeat-associated core domain-containing protein n=1 Tax=Flavobacterium sp. LHD-80 TaxID=3071411 RepID=UPI0035A8CC44
MYDYAARNYDPALGRWMNIDALSELSRRWSPYSYCYSNPVRYVDPDGMLAKSVIDDLISKSDNDKETKWTFNSDGTATGSNGQTANTGENQEDADGP